MKVSLFKDLFKSKAVPFVIPIEKVVERIRQGTSKDKIEKIRASQSKELTKQLKESLPSILFAGEFLERNSKGLKIHSGLMVLDFDNFESDEVLEVQKLILRANPHFLLVFVSPSGNGLKGVVRIPTTTTIETHPQYFKEFQSLFKFDYFDPTSCNVDRVCFESFDPDIYVNYNATVFEPILVDKGSLFSERTPIFLLKSEDKIIEKIMAFNWKRDFVQGERNAFIFDLAGAFCEYGISETSAIGYIQNNIVFGDFKDAEALTTIKSAYRKRKFDSKYFEDWQFLTKVKADLSKGKKKVIEKFGISESQFDEISESFEQEDFWFFTENKDGVKKVNIDAYRYKHFLESVGFKKHYPTDAQVPTWVRIIENRVKITSVAKIKDFVLDYLQEKRQFDVWNYCAKFQNLFSEAFLLMLESVPLQMIQDTKDVSYIAYKNGILEVNQDSAKLIDYPDIDFYIWDSHILPRDFVAVKENENDFKQFVRYISAGQTLPFECVFGYYISTFKSRSLNKAVILNDENITEAPEGGTGKGIIQQAISHVRKTSFIDGKTFDNKKAFALQTITLDTKVVIWDDVPKSFNIEDQFSLITEGMTIERKNKDAVKLDVKDSPKILISTNYALKGAGNSHNRRRYELEISQYFSEDKTPEDVFGKQLFDDWNITEWNLFDNYMVECLQLFLKNGLVKQKTKNLKVRKFVAETSFEFYEFSKSNIQIDSRIEKQVSYNLFISEYPDYKDFRWFNRKKYGVWVEKYAHFLGVNYADGDQNGMKYFEIGATDKVEDDGFFV